MMHRLPAELYSWLSETGSLTKRLRSVYGSGFSVNVLFHQWKPAFIDETQLLSIPTAHFHLLREVVLSGNGQPLVLARTVLPAQTIKIAHRNLSHLGNRPLGEVIFAYSDLELRQRQFCQVSTNNWTPQLQTRCTIDQIISGRRTVYVIHNQPLLVAEFFLPALLEKFSADNNLFGEELGTKPL
ncbi:chorismate lyase [Methylomonas sp. AM2-LC]|uniref:chorismate--pyruvate lyase family protein n=1 Tax=Methylomonas sp. AM2-LC TaxID=3153301 RepID=UPI003267C773